MKTMESLLKINTHTSMGDKGRNARACVQINTNQLLNRRICTGDFRQLMIYESLNKVCFGCSKVSHSKPSYPYGASMEIEIVSPKRSSS